jgi:Short C-terminal domain
MMRDATSAAEAEFEAARQSEEEKAAWPDKSAPRRNDRADWRRAHINDVPHLHDSGAITDDEYAAVKARLIHERH